MTFLIQGVSCADFYIKNNGRISGGDERLQAGALYRLEPRLCGGKGGHSFLLFPPPFLTDPVGSPESPENYACLSQNARVLLFPNLVQCACATGFGSMLRALGAQIEKTTNREACRDLSGRRLRDVNHEKE